MAEVRLREGESIDSALRRVKRKVQTEKRMRTSVESLPNSVSPLNPGSSVAMRKKRKQFIRSRKSIKNSRIMKLGSIAKYTARRRVAPEKQI